MKTKIEELQEGFKKTMADESNIKDKDEQGKYIKKPSPDDEPFEPKKDEEIDLGWKF